jgi:hypothetical protein
MLVLVLEPGVEKRYFDDEDDGPQPELAIP